MKATLIKALARCRVACTVVVYFSMITILDYAPDSLRRSVLKDEYEGEALEQRLKMKIGGGWVCPAVPVLPCRPISSLIPPPPHTRARARALPRHHNTRLVAEHVQSSLEDVVRQHAAQAQGGRPGALRRAAARCGGGPAYHRAGASRPPRSAAGS